MEGDSKNLGVLFPESRDSLSIIGGWHCCLPESYQVVLRPLSVPRHPIKFHQRMFGFLLLVVQADHHHWEPIKCKENAILSYLKIFHYTIIMLHCMLHHTVLYYKANQTTLLVSRPPVFIFLCGRAVIIHYSLFNIMAF